MELIIITPETTAENEALLVNAMFEAGLMRLHTRKPLFGAREYETYLSAIDPNYYSRIVIHDCFELYHAFRLGGIHLNSSIRNAGVHESVRQNIQPSRVSSSFHSWSEIAENEFPYGYVFISPVFDSISKNDYLASIDMYGAGVLRAQLSSANRRCPGIIGLGGVGLPQLQALHKSGFDGAAMLGSIWLAPDPVERFKEAISMVRSL